ncbi:uromodulin-like [Bombina bombina]|uniref:uromodulin-like n=1 Tax=Bombina bombina TaxID=8345 RepID=UPI00235AD70D|nr:uromodulin-like [Bombina bombina]
MMKLYLFLLLTFCCLISVFAECPTCADDQTCNNSTEKCDCIKSLYNVTANPPTPIIECTSGKLNLYVSKCQLEVNHYMSSNVHLNNMSCVGMDDIKNTTAQVAFHLELKNGECGTNVEVKNDLIIYSNTLYISAKQSGLIVSRNNVTINFSCVFPQNSTVSSNVTLKPKLGTTQLVSPEGNAVFTIAMAVYTDNQFTKMVTSDTVLKVEDDVYVSVLIPSLDAEEFAVKVLRLYATGTNDPASSPIYLIVDGCPNADLDANIFTIIKNGMTNEARFIMKVFKISGYDTVNLFADVTICENNCTSDCSGGKSNQEKQAQNIATVRVDELIAEPRLDSGALDRFSMPWTLSSLLMSLLFIKLV